MNHIFVGTSGWAYPSWKPGFYPEKLAAKKFLEYYGTRLNSVEVNYTFRQLPSASTLNGWLAATPEGFAFSFKAPQRITHFARLKGCGEALHSFYSALDPVRTAGKLGMVLFQLPPNLKKDLLLLDRFLSDAIRPGLRLAFEFRNESWFSDDVFAGLAGQNAAVCVAESDQLQTPDVKTASFRCYRLRRTDYSEAQVRSVAAKLRENAAETDVFAYFKHEEDPSGAINAASVLDQVRG